MPGERASEACNCEKCLPPVARPACMSRPAGSGCGGEILQLGRNRELKFNFPREQREKNNLIGRTQGRRTTQGGDQREWPLCNFAIWRRHIHRPIQSIHSLIPIQRVWQTPKQHDFASSLDIHNSGLGFKHYQITHCCVIDEFC